MVADAFVQCRVPAETKARLRALAAARQVPESTIVKQALDAALTSAGAVIDAPPSPARLERLAIRIGADDRALLAARAAARQLAPATYVGVVVRAHLRQLAPLPAAELAALKDSATQIRTIGRLLNLFVRAVQRGAPDGGFNLEHAKQLVRICMTVREEVKDVVRANLTSWETGHVD